ncbi:MAG: GntR family transcriptional regulator [Acidobacteriota bacterium]
MPVKNPVRRPQPAPAAPAEHRFEPVEPPTLKERIAAEIRRAILTGDLPPGARIVETRLAGQMRVAQTTVREAIQELEKQGLVVKYVNRETLVRKLSLAELEQLFHLRLDLEGLAAELAHPNATDENLAALHEIVEMMRRSARKKDIAEFYRFDIEFHRQLSKLTKNQFLEAALAPLLVGPVAFVLAGAPFPMVENYVQVARDHAEILEALKASTPKAARKMIEAKLRRWHQGQLRNFRNRVPG